MTQRSKGTSSGKGMNHGIVFNRHKTSNGRVKRGSGIGWCMILAAILLIVPAVGFADDVSEPADQPSLEDRFNQEDQDGDGRVSQDEFSGPSEHFGDIDQNGDGYIDSDETPPGPRGGGPAGQSGGGPGGRGPRN